MAHRLPPRALRRAVLLGLTTLMLVPAIPPSAPAIAATLTKRAVVTGLDNPVTFTFAPDGRIFYGERFSGEIHIFDPTTRRDELFASFSVGQLQEQGLLGVVLHPAYPTKPFVYVYLTRDLSGGAGTDVRNQILRVRDVGGTAGRTTVLMENTVGPAHNGGELAFGPDGMLYAFIGEKTAPANAQDLSNVFGKVIRMTPNGEIPADNPFLGRPGVNGYLYDYGHRNGFGLAFDPVSGALWQSEAGPECNDEINRILPGRNYGWGRNATCSTPPDAPLNTNQDGPRPVLPKVSFSPVITPDGMTFCSSCGLGARAEGDLFFGYFLDLGAPEGSPRSGIRQASISSNRMRIRSVAIALPNNRFVFTVESAPDGSLYFSDSVGIYELTA
jgi:glucose/arabinose dehydrogenase